MPILRPKAYAINQIICRILDGAYPAGSVLPAERILAEEIGVTRQTVREVLQRLEGEGWITIQHGKQTLINDYWQEGGQGILSSIARFAEEIPLDFIKDLLVIRALILPMSAKTAAESEPEILLRLLAESKNLEENAAAYVEFDWKLQCLFARYSSNRIIPLMMNDYTAIFNRFGLLYFSLDIAREISKNYYRQLIEAIQEEPARVEGIVKDTLLKSNEIMELAVDQSHLSKKRN